ncbi:K+ transport system, NAD-binding component [Halobacteroides halobius DSM 5150]|uniref:Trk system potassium uptake protein TrkA n=1 Tax=Halobacteroides halobius (strain ATCC 35273 / DSM 5150 / MD-1) TaxID=748449 RepID=L0KCA2_HALHC|nr:TrkA family potassium uptake protein [Halobacteroides halobius]AGB42180.1 K+ transport system, NAD-binding component [Halobacteroides halobius DSM 5150]
MNIIIVGGGKKGFQLAKYCHKFGHQVTVIESNKEKINKLKDKLEVNVLLGDGTKRDYLEKAGAEEGDIVVAATSNDQDNLVICQLAERQFDIGRTLALVNNPGNEKLFEWLGVNQVVSSTSLMLGLIEEEIEWKEKSNLWADSINQLKMHYIQVEEEAIACNQKIKDITIPDEAILITILRGDQAIVPRGNTTIKAKDTVIALADPEVKDKLLSLMKNNTD